MSFKTAVLGTLQMNSGRLCRSNASGTPVLTNFKGEALESRLLLSRMWRLTLAVEHHHDTLRCNFRGMFPSLPLLSDPVVPTKHPLKCRDISARLMVSVSEMRRWILALRTGGSSVFMKFHTLTRIG